MASGDFFSPFSSLSQSLYQSSFSLSLEQAVFNTLMKLTIFEQNAHVRLDTAIADASKFIANENEYHISTLISFKQELVLAPNLWGSLIKKKNERRPAAGPFADLTFEPNLNFLTVKKESAANASFIGLLHSSGSPHLFFLNDCSGESLQCVKADSYPLPSSVLTFNGALTCNNKSMLRFTSALKPLFLEPQSMPFFQQAPVLEHAQTAFLGIELGIAERSYFVALSKITSLTIFMNKS